MDDFFWLSIFVWGMLEHPRLRYCSLSLLQKKEEQYLLGLLKFWKELMAHFGIQIGSIHR